MIRPDEPHATGGRLLMSLTLTAGLFLNGLSARAQSTTPAVTSGGDVMRGWRVFHEKQCADCHAIWDQGGRVGPDLGRIRVDRLSDGQLAGVMWNHIPKMLGQLKQTGRLPVTLTRDNMTDLFALLFFVRQLDELGDPVRGEGILRAKGCGECHETDASGTSVGPDLTKWGQYTNPIVWAQLMWEHAPMMEEAMKRSGINWPKLEGADLVHLIAYIRSIAEQGEKKTYLRPGSVGHGETLFREKGCNGCHPGAGPDLSRADLPHSVGALASRMWNHSPSMVRAMREKDLSQPSLTAQDLADIVAYVLALGNADRGGDPSRGKQVFARKGCIQCHEGADVGAGDAAPPDVTKLGTDATPVKMATAMWNHGGTMLERITEAGLSWPVFGQEEMVDLLAYLNAVQSDAGAGDGPGD